MVTEFKRSVDTSMFIKQFIPTIGIRHLYGSENICKFLMFSTFFLFI